MSVPSVDENEIEELDLPGRRLRWLVTEESLNAKYLSCCVIRVAPGKTVKPAHSHPQGEELIYIIRGSGRVWIEGEIGVVKAGTAVLFRQGLVHMLQNNGAEEMKVVCFFAPATNLDNYKFFEDVEFPE